ncbi:MAG: histone H1 [Candidatus Kapabacteria bacterium]|nr:histone H1 [Candidatus Kapabacteria bacterium]
MNRYEELQALIRTFEKDFTKFYDKGNKEAGIRLRKQMQTLRAFAKTVRDEVQEKNNPSTSIDARK